MSFDLLALLKKSQTSLKGYINFQELVKSIGLAVASAGSFGAVLQFLGSNLNSFIVDPVALLNIQHIISDASAKNWLAVGLGLFTLGVSLYNKFNQGAVVLNPSRIAEAKSLVIEPVVKKTEEEKVIDGIVQPPA